MINENQGFDEYNIVKIIRVSGNRATYLLKNGGRGEWDFVNYPKGADRKLTPLEIELL